MKKNRIIIVISFLLLGIILSCKKSDTPKDYGASIKDKTWSGVLTYTGKIVEYYSVHFNGDNTLEWSQLSDNYMGHWILINNQLTISFDANSDKINAIISEDNLIQNISDNTGAYEVNSCILVADPGISLDNTVWNGSETNTITGTTKEFLMSFKPGNIVEIKNSNTAPWSASYSRHAAGSAIRISGGFFSVLVSSGEMRGCDGNAAFPWQATKQ